MTEDPTKAPQVTPTPPVRGGSSGLVGLCLLGWGLAMAFQVTPHESPWVGLGLAVFGAALLITSRGLPAVPILPSWIMVALGASAIAGMVGFALLTKSPWNSLKILILLLGFALVACAPFLRHEFRLPLRNRPRVAVGHVALYATFVLGTPLMMWALQAGFKSLVGTTPTEAFVRVALLPPVGVLIRLMGIEPSFRGQTITYATPGGPLAVDVGAACSGIQAMALFGAVLAIYVIAERPRGGRLALWTLIGLGGVYATNLLRLAVLMLIGYQWGPEALVQAHANAGWIFFVAWALLFAWIVRGDGTRAKATPA